MQEKKPLKKTSCLIANRENIYEQETMTLQPYEAFVLYKKTEE